MEELKAVYVCPRCFSTGEAAGPCPRCNLARQQCELGEPDSEFRRAPLWWVVKGAPYLRVQLNEHK